MLTYLENMFLECVLKVLYEDDIYPEIQVAPWAYNDILGVGVLAYQDTWGCATL